MVTEVQGAPKEQARILRILQAAPRYKRISKPPQDKGYPSRPKIKMLSTEMNDQSDPNHMAAAAEQRASAEGSHLAAPVGAAAAATTTYSKAEGKKRAPPSAAPVFGDDSDSD